MLLPENYRHVVLLQLHNEDLMYEKGAFYLCLIKLGLWVYHMGNTAGSTKAWWHHFAWKTTKQKNDGILTLRHVLNLLEPKDKLDVL